ncbi:hypothetical protein BK662_07000 [Pseudomonas frederiksbergensis]|uniref:Uncharacterized protein n=1 Tax=Pseudomonas frederiksbergensis TaxID=104087 RepID=A0A423HW71_9PSED|nr:hypothetical protein [Pseudomonas frederiksbergensis]RON17470.1 hypothetical protein BK662_07000 [Pseudomonas frederiksbergensis]
MHPAILYLDQVELLPLPEDFAPTGDAASRYQQRLDRIGQQRAQGNASGFVAVARQADGVDYWDGE